MDTKKGERTGIIGKVSGGTQRSKTTIIEKDGKSYLYNFDTREYELIDLPETTRQEELATGRKDNTRLIRDKIKRDLQNRVFNLNKHIKKYGMSVNEILENNPIAKKRGMEGGFRVWGIGWGHTAGELQAFLEELEEKIRDEDQEHTQEDVELFDSLLDQLSRP